MAYVYATGQIRVTIFSTGGKFRPVSNFTELHALTQAARSYALLANLNIRRVFVEVYKACLNCSSPLLNGFTNIVRSQTSLLNT